MHIVLKIASQIVQVIGLNKNEMEHELYCESKDFFNLFYKIKS